MKRLALLVTTWLLCGLTAVSFAQGVQRGTIRGVVHDDQGLAVPGVTVTVTSPALQGTRTVVTDGEGGYTLAALPAGEYTITFELSNFGTVKRVTIVPVGLTVEQNVNIKPAGVAETVQVVAETPAPIATPVLGINVSHDEVQLLATPRNLQGIATLSPSVSEYSPNGGQLVINGAFAYDNVFMVNGVDVNDNLFANPQNLFIEDAIEETQVLTSGISAEYGRFTGGVVNAVTKSGGNNFSGSFRLNFLNPAWSKETPFEVSRGVTRPNKLQETYEGTFGGPIVRDRLWFFTAGRYASVQQDRTLTTTAIQVIQDDKNKRGEVKVTGTVAQNHTIQGGYLNNARSVSNTSGLFSFAISPEDLITRSLPNWYYFTNYRGVLGKNLMAEAQYSTRRFKFSGDGGTSTNITDSPIFTLNISPAGFYNSPYFDATDPEQRNNRQVTGNLTYFATGAGRHEIKGGYEWFRSQRTGGNSQSASSYVFNADYLTDAAGKPVFDSTGRLIPLWQPGDTYVDFFPAVRGAVMNTDTHSLFVQDHWTLNPNWSFDLGARYEHANVKSTGDIISVNNGRTVPRLAAAYDVQGNGDHIVHVTYAWYSGRYNEALVGANSPVGNPADVGITYLGPAGQGRNFAPGFNLANYPVTQDNAVVFSAPTANVFMDPNVRTPIVKEFTTRYGVNLFAGRGYAEAAYIHRDTVDMIEDFKTRAEGTTHVVVAGVDAGFATNQVFRNTDLAKRKFDATVFGSRYRMTNNWSINGHYTLQLKNEGNYEGEGTNTPGATSIIGNYPEAFNEARSYPFGRLQDFQRHRLRVWSIYNFGLGRVGTFSLSGMWRVDSAQVYQIRATNQSLTATQRSILRNAGYPDAPINQTVYFVGRNPQEGKGYGLLDTSLNYDVPVFRSLRPWVKFDVYNLLNNQKLIFWDRTVRQDPATPVDSLGLRTGYIKGANFGTATSNAHFPVPFGGQDGGRTFRVALGLRF